MNQNNQTESQTIGQFIKQARERAQLTTKELSRSTRIGVTMLELLEANELSQLPNRAYVSGYIKSCCKELGLNQRQALEILEYTYSAQNSILEKKEKFEQSADKVKYRRQDQAKAEAPINPLVKGSILVVAVLAILLVYKFSNLNSPENSKIATSVIEEAKVEPTAISEETPMLSEEQKTVATTPTPPVSKPESKAVTPSAPPVTAPKAEETKTVKKAEPVVTNSKYEPVNPVSLRPITQKLYQVRTPSPKEMAIIPANYQKALVQGKQNLYIHASKEDSWLTYKKDNEEIKALKLRKGHALFLTGDEFRLFFGNVNATTLFLNNQLIDPQSTSGVKSIVIPDGNASKYKIPLFVYLKDGRIITSEQFEAP